MCAESTTPTVRHLRKGCGKDRRFRMGLMGFKKGAAKGLCGAEPGSLDIDPKAAKLLIERSVQMKAFAAAGVYVPGNAEMTHTWVAEMCPACLKAAGIAD